MQNLTPHQALAYKLRMEGKSFDEIGRVMGRHKTRAQFRFEQARRILERAERLRTGEELPHPFEGLSAHTANALNDGGFSTREEVVAALKSGTLAEVCKVRAFGRVAYLETCRWAGVEPKLKSRGSWKFDPWTGEPLK